MRFSPAVVVLLFLAGCAIAPTPLTTPAAAPSDLAGQRAEVVAALGRLSAETKDREARLDARAATLSGSERDRQYDAIVVAHKLAEADILEPMAARGNAEAMHRLGTRLRDSSEPDDVNRWLNLETAASNLGHPAAHDELVRWYWHQRASGSIEDVQRNRTTALDYAGKAAAAGYMHSLDRIATYVAGNVHQYPASLEIARRLMELCARTGYGPCQERLALKGSYDYGLRAEDEYLWLSRLALREPERFAQRKDVAWSRLGPDVQAKVHESARAWRPAAWTELGDEWAEIKRLILAHGESSIGAETSCTTMTPWCRGDLIGR